MQKMHLGAWVVILLCAANIVSSSGHEDSEMLRNTISSYKRSLPDLEEHGKKQYRDMERRRSSKMRLTENEKGQKGKGTYGGANVVHRKPEKSGALLHSPSFLFSSAVLGFLLFLLPYFDE